MNREPIGLYIIRFFTGIGLFAFMFMLYWSSLLIEQDMKGLQAEIAQLREQLTLQHGGSPVSTAAPVAQPAASSITSSMANPLIPNLLKEDPFFLTTLPQKLLPPGFRPWGAFKSATIGKPENLHPFSNWAEVATWAELCSVAVASSKFGIFESLSPDMAWKMEERINEQGAPEFWIFLRDNVFWAPIEERFFGSDFKLAPHFSEKHQVTAEDFKFKFDAFMNPNNQETGAIALRTLYEDVEEIRIVDKLTFVVRWKTKEFKEGDVTIKKTKYIAKLLTGGMQPLASFVYKYFPNGKKIVEEDTDPNTYRKNSVWAQNFAQHWAKNVIPSCGPWLFDELTDRQIQFSRNPHFYRPLAALADKSVFAFKNTPDLMWQDFKSNLTDSYPLQPGQEVELEAFLNSPQYIKQADAHAAINRLDFLRRIYFYVGWNQATPFFATRPVRQAMTMAIDRQRIIEQNLNGLGEEITGPFFKYSPAYDPSIAPWPFDPLAAKQLLEAEGWMDSDGDGILDKEINGKNVKFSFTLTYFVKNPTTKSICEYISTALKEIGIQCLLNGVDIADLSARFEQKNFDAILMGWGQASPPEDPWQIWHSEGAKLPGSSNAIGFAHTEADKIIEALQYEYDPIQRRALYHRFDKIMHEEQPYTFLYNPKTAFLFREYLQNVFIPADRQDLVPGANIGEPDSNIFWLKKW